jgi:hypothetical protein
VDFSLQEPPQEPGSIVQSKKWNGPIFMSCSFAITLLGKDVVDLCLVARFAREADPRWQW